MMNTILFYAALATCLTPWVTSPIALLLGIVIGQSSGSPLGARQKKITTYLLQTCVVGLGFGLSATQALKATSEGWLLTIVTIVGTLLLGRLIGRLLGLDNTTSHLVAAGTAICGGSAIAAVAPAINADTDKTTVALATVFVLNSVALLTFPPIGHWLGMSQEMFGLWSALAIHDTSSVVGAASTYGTGALAVASTVKLARALWIVPLTLFSAWLFNGKSAMGTFPWFIVLFVIAIFVAPYVPFADGISAAARKGLTITLFLIGSSLTRASVKAVGAKPLVAGLTLWILVSVTTAFLVMYSAG